MTVTTSSPNNLTYTNRQAKSGIDYVSDQDVIEMFGLDPSLRGEELDKAAEAACKKLNEEDAARQLY